MLEIIPLLLVVVIPLSVQAGLFTEFFSTSTSDVAEISSPRGSIIDDKLLSAYKTSNPLAAIGGGDIFINEGALLPGGSVGKDVIATDKDKVGEILVYQVREGDTLSQIAEMFEVTSNTILWANDLGSSKDIHPGDSLIILPIVGIQHVVKKGDTIATIAKKYEGNADEIRSFNQVSDDSLTVGMTIMVPGGNLHTSAPKKTSGSSSGSKTSGFINPAPGAIKTQGIHGYNGVDFGGPTGSTVRAAASGEVIVSKSGGYNGGYGSYIVIKHSNGTQTLYAHLSKNSVGVGQVVAAGETIGAIGNTGRSTGPHLHFEVRGGRNPF